MSNIDINKRIQRYRTDDEMQTALSAFVHGRPTMHIPAQVEDHDMVLLDAIRELVDRRAQQPVTPVELQQQVQELEERSNRIDTAVQTMIDNLMGCREQVL
jgi:hypothetical protein